MPHAYATTAQLRRALGNPSTTEQPEADLLRALEAAAEAIDAYAGRTFQPYSGVVYPDLTGVHGRGRLYTPDFLSLTEVAQDDGTGAYATAWATTDYLAYPYDAPSHQRPYIALERAYAGNYIWPSYYPNWLRLTGLFGYWQKLADSGATVAEAIDLTETAIDISDQSLLGAGMTVKIDSEQVYLTALTDGTPDMMTVERGVNGTTGATHLTATAIYRFVYPGAVAEASLAYAGAVRGGSFLAGVGGVTRERAGDIEVQYGSGSSGASGSNAFDFSPWLTSYRRRTLFS